MQKCQRASGMVAAVGLVFDVVFAAAGSSASAAPGDLPAYLNDRGTGVASSMTGTYIRKNDLIVYPYWEYYLDNDYEYKPAELGFGLDQDFRGRYRESEYLFFLTALPNIWRFRPNWQ